jgi:hypothetical protein
LWIHGAQSAAEVGEVRVVDLVGFQLDSDEHAADAEQGRANSGGEQDRRRQNPIPIVSE